MSFSPTAVTTQTTLFSNTTPFQPVDPKCKVYTNSSDGIYIKQYEGIPENLLLNIVVWFVLVFLFTILRRIGDYGRFGLIKNDEERWTSKFFSPLTRTNSMVPSSSDGGNESIINPSIVTLSSEEIPQSAEYKDLHLFSWFANLFKLKDKHINDKCGKDAIYYLFFQRYLIVFMLVITILSVSILLPINLNGSAFADESSFGATTIVNILPTSPLLWIHLVLSWFFMFIGVFFILHFSKRMQYTESDYISRTVLIRSLPSKFCKESIIRKHFSEAYPDLKIKDVQFAFNITKLAKFEKTRKSMHIGKTQSEKIFERTGQRPLMHPHHFGSLIELCCCCCFCLEKHLVDSITFYTNHENDLKLKINEYRESILKKPLGILFVTFEKQEDAAKFIKDYTLGLFGEILGVSCQSKRMCLNCYLCKHLPKQSSVGEQIKCSQWSAKYAPAPNNIKWENISRIGSMWWLRMILINFILVIVMIFFTTPSILIESLPIASYFNVQWFESWLPNSFALILPSLILRLLTPLLPVAVAWTALAEMHWTKSAENRSMMVKTFILLLFMVLILPTLGLTSINAVFQWIGTKDTDNIKWRCVSDNGAFFLKYVTTCSFIGTAFDLLRLPDLLLYLIKMFWSRSSAERLAVRMQTAFEFDYGVQYAWIITIFTITISYSVVCPLITPFGLAYFVLKHLVDRYNIYFAYTTTKVDKNIHKSAVTFTIFSLVMLQLCILFFIAIRNKGNITTNAIFTVQVVVIFFTGIIFCGRIFFGYFKRLLPFMPPPQPRTGNNADSNNGGLTCFDENNLDSDGDGDADGEEYQYEWVRQTGGDDNDTIDADAKSKKTTTTDVNSNKSNNNNNNNNQNVQPIMSSLNLEDIKITPVGSLANRNGDTIKKSNKYKNIKIHSPFVPLLLRTVSMEQKVLAAEKEQVVNTRNTKSLPTTLEQRNESESEQPPFSLTTNEPINPPPPTPSTPPLKRQESLLLSEHQINLEFSQSHLNNTSSSNDSIKSKKSQHSSPVSYQLDEMNNGNNDGEGLVNLNFLGEKKFKNKKSEENKSFQHDY